MRAARMHAYSAPLVLEEVPIPGFDADEALVRVKAAGMCRTDVQLIDGYFRSYAPISFPLTPGHEIAGVVEKIGSAAAKRFGLVEGDPVVVSGGWGDGTCRHCHRGNEQICTAGRWPGFGEHGGYAEFLPVPARHLIKVDPTLGILPEELAPLTDAGLTPYRGIKKLRAAGAMGPGRVLAVIGVSALGTYAVQYAKLLGGGATIVAMARDSRKLAAARELGADHVIAIGDKSIEDIREVLRREVGVGEIDAAIDCAGAEQTIRLGFGLLAVAGHFVSVGLVGDRIELPLFPFVAREYTYHGSFWGNHEDLVEVMELARQRRIRHSIDVIGFDEINATLQRLRVGDVVGRAVIRYGSTPGR